MKMKPGYVFPPGYKQTEVGVIPEEWEVRSLLTAVRIANGQVDPKTEPYKSMILVAPDHIESATGRLLDKQTAAEQRVISGKYVFGEGDIVYSKIRPYLRKAILAEFDGLCSADMYPLKPANDVSAGFMLSVLLGHRFSKYAESVSVRSGMPKINRAELAEYDFALPPLPEQCAIAGALNDVDALIGSLDQLIAKKHDLKQAAMQQLLTGQSRLPGFELIPGYKTTEVGVIPEDWEIRLLPDVCRFRGGKAHEQHISEFGRFVCVNSKFISTDGKVRKYSTANFCCAKQNDILMVMSDLPNGRALAKAYLVEQDDLYAVNQRVCALTAFRDCPKYLFYILNRNPYFLKFDDGVSQTHLLNHVFRNCPLPIPPTVPEQEAIAEVLSDIDSDLATLTQRRDKTRAIKQGMMQELLTGRTRLV